jgi:type II secretory pathway pseudopilin PulG
MAALLVMLTIMSIMMTVAMPVWRQQAQREKEEELVWRGQQYVRAIRLYQAKNQSFPPSLDVLVQGRYIRKKYKDPITDDEFVPLGAAGAPGVAGQPGQVGVPGQAGVPGPVGQPAVPVQPGQPGGAFPGAAPLGGIIGVASKSKAESIRNYQGRTHYNEWTFVFVNMRPGRGALPGQPGLPGGRGGQPQPGLPQPGGRGRGRGAQPGTIPSIERPGTRPGGPGPGATPFPFPVGRRGGGGL